MTALRLTPQRARVLRLLATASPLTTGQIARAMDSAPNTTAMLLAPLRDELGLITASPYALTPAGRLALDLHERALRARRAA